MRLAYSFARKSSPSYMEAWALLLPGMGGGVLLPRSSRRRTTAFECLSSACHSMPSSAQARWRFRMRPDGAQQPVPNIPMSFDSKCRSTTLAMCDIPVKLETNVKSPSHTAARYLRWLLATTIGMTRIMVPPSDCKTSLTCSAHKTARPPDPVHAAGQLPAQPRGNKVLGWMNADERVHLRVEEGDEYVRHYNDDRLALEERRRRYRQTQHEPEDEQRRSGLRQVCPLLVRHLLGDIYGSHRVDFVVFDPAAINMRGPTAALIDAHDLYNPVAQDAVILLLPTCLNLHGIEGLSQPGAIDDLLGMGTVYGSVATPGRLSGVMGADSGSAFTSASGSS